MDFIYIFSGIWMEIINCSEGDLLSMDVFTVFLDSYCVLKLCPGQQSHHCFKTMLERHGVGAKPVLTGKSVHNQRIKRLLVDVYKNGLDYFMPPPTTIHHHIPAVPRLVLGNKYLCKAECWAHNTCGKLRPGSQVLAHR